MKSKAVAVLLLLACGAAPSPVEGIVHEPCAPLLIVPADGATPAQRDALTRAAALWNMIGFTQLATEGDAEPITVRFSDASAFFHGYYDPETGEVLINNDLDDPGELGVVVAHELGHAMGLLHVPPSERASVMNPGNLSTPPGLEDSALLERRCGH